MDLYTGKLRPHNPLDYLIKRTLVTPQTMPIPIWLKFMSEITDRDDGLIAYLQKLAGYCLTGDVREESLYLLIGGGRNGKGVWTKTLMQILGGDYAKPAPNGMFEEHRNDRHLTEIASLWGTRLVVAAETGQGAQLDEPKVKMLTGGDLVTARFMRCDEFMFDPSHKILIAGQDEPQLRGVSVAMQARVKLIPFLVSFAGREDKELKQKLMPEYAGILHWAIQGCLAWQDEGLDPPSVVKDATTKYFQNEDKLGLWFEERLVRNPNGFEADSELFEDWRTWCGKSGVTVTHSKKQLMEALEKAPYQFPEYRTSFARCHKGLSFNPQAREELDKAAQEQQARNERRWGR